MRTKGHLMCVCLNNQQLVLIYSELSEKGCQVQLNDQHNSDFYTLIRDRVVGGPSIFFVITKKNTKQSSDPSNWKNQLCVKKFKASIHMHHITGVSCSLCLWALPKDKKQKNPMMSFACITLTRAKLHMVGWVEWHAQTAFPFIQAQLQRSYTGWQEVSHWWFLCEQSDSLSVQWMLLAWSSVFNNLRC